MENKIPNTANIDHIQYIFFLMLTIIRPTIKFTFIKNVFIKNKIQQIQQTKLYIVQYQLIHI